MSTTDQEWVQKEIQGFCEGIMERGDWTEFHINIGKQYAVKLSTKLPEVIEAGRAAGKEQAIWRFGEADGADNPHRPGTKYKNRRLSGVEVGGQLTMSDTGSSSSGGGGGRGGGGGAHSPEERRSIEKQTILKAMIPLHPKIESEGDWWRVVRLCDTWMMESKLKEQPTEPPPAEDPVDQPVPDEDDIPF